MLLAYKLKKKKHGIAVSYCDNITGIWEQTGCTFQVYNIHLMHHHPYSCQYAIPLRTVTKGTASCYQAMLTGPVIQATELEVSLSLPLYIPLLSDIAHCYRLLQIWMRSCRLLETLDPCCSWAGGACCIYWEVRAILFSVLLCWYSANMVK